MKKRALLKDLIKSQLELKKRPLNGVLILALKIVLMKNILTINSKKKLEILYQLSIITISQIVVGIINYYSKKE